MKRKLLAAAVLAASAGAQAAWVTTDLGEDVYPVITGVNGTVIAQGITSRSSTTVRSMPGGGVQTLPLVDTVYSRPTSINGLGHIAGYATKTGGTSYGFLYRDGVLTELTLGGSWVYAPLVNNGGLLAGISNMPGGTDMHAFTYNRGTLATLPISGPELELAGLNASGQLTGYGLPAGDASHAFLYSDGTVTDLGTVPGYTHSVATAINDAGQVAGWAGMDTWYPGRAFRYSGGVMTDLGTLGGPTSGALAINGAGHVVGMADTGQEYLFHAFLHDGEKMVDLGTLGGDLSYATHINGAGQILGLTSTADGSAAEFLYENGRMYNIADLATGYTEVRNTSLSESGQIAGVGLANGKWHGFLLSWVQDAAPLVTAKKSGGLALAETGLQGNAAAKPRASIAAQRAALCRHAGLVKGASYVPPYCTAKPAK
jgi:probable HAF family extracellular repeat protein